MMGSGRRPPGPPRRPLQFDYSRRQLFQLAGPVGEGATAGQSPKPSFKLAMLSTLTDAQLSCVAPVLMPGCELSIRDGMVWGTPATAGVPGRSLFPADPANLIALNLFNGNYDLATIADIIGHELDEPLDLAFAVARSTFLTLVLARLAVPA